MQSCFFQFYPLPATFENNAFSFHLICRLFRLLVAHLQSEYHPPPTPHPTWWVFNGLVILWRKKTFCLFFYRIYRNMHRRFSLGTPNNNNRNLSWKNIKGNIRGDSWETRARVAMKMSVHQHNFPNALLIQYDFIYNFLCPF